MFLQSVFNWTVRHLNCTGLQEMWLILSTNNPQMTSQVQYYPKFCILYTEHDSMNDI